MTPSVRPGLEVLIEERGALIRGSRVGLLCHASSVDRSFAHATELLVERGGARLVKLFAPEHGTGGVEQDMAAVREATDPHTGLPVVSLYGDDETSLTPRPADLEGLDVLVSDLQDVGSRYYTFANTVIRALPVAARAGIRVVVADRPNPIDGATIEGNLVGEPFRSFVGELSIANRHGMTLGELCLLARQARSIDVDLEVVPARGWRRELWWDGTGLPWVLPSPNMPTLETATVYPGTCLIEGTNLSEGRGTTRPFELVGAPWLDGMALAATLAAARLPGVRFRPARFSPCFHKHAGEPCGGVQIHVTDRHAFRPVRTGVAVVIAARRQQPEQFFWRTDRYEFVDDIPAFDLLAGGSGWREMIEQGAEAGDIAAQWHDDEGKTADLRGQVAIYPLS